MRRRAFSLHNDEINGFDGAGSISDLEKLKISRPIIVVLVRARPNEELLFRHIFEGLSYGTIEITDTRICQRGWCQKLCFHLRGVGWCFVMDETVERLLVEPLKGVGNI